MLALGSGAKWLDDFFLLSWWIGIDPLGALARPVSCNCDDREKEPLGIVLNAQERYSAGQINPF